MRDECVKSRGDAKRDGRGWSRARRGMGGVRAGVAALALAMLALVVLVGVVKPARGAAEVVRQSETGVVTRVNIGTEGVVEYRVQKEDGRVPRLRGARVDRLSGAMVWIDGLREEADAGVYTVRFVANIPGEFDLAGLMERVDGGSTATLPALPVSVWGFLPEDHDGRLLELADVRPSRLGGYRAWMIALGVVWLTPLMVVIARRLMRRRAVELAEIEPKPSLADQLGPLVEAAINGTADSATQSRLEMLLLGYWRERAGLRELPMREAPERLRAEPQAGRLLGAVERWLHAPPGRSDVGSMKAGVHSGVRKDDASPLATARAEAVELLAPYRRVPAFRTGEAESGDARGVGAQTQKSTQCKPTPCPLPLGGGSERDSKPSGEGAAA